MLRLKTLGGLKVHRDDRELVDLPGQPLRCALLVHLAVEREVTRDSVLTLLWPEKDEERARHSLSQLLYELRRECGDGWIEIHGEQLRVTDDLRVDATEFEALVEGGAFGEALEHYGGAFLEDTHLARTQPFQSWVDRRRSRLSRFHRKARSGFVTERIEAGELDEALAAARRWVELEPLDDGAHHRLIQLLARAGRRSAALEHYERYERLIGQELDVEPLDETTSLVERIREGGAESPAAPPEDAGAGAPSPRESAGDAADERAQKPVPDRTEEDAAPRWARFLDELERRRVIRVGLAYVAGAFIVLGTVDLLLPVLSLPESTYRVVVLILVLGLPPALVLAWAFDVTPGGIRAGGKATADDGRSVPDATGSGGDGLRVRETAERPYRVGSPSRGRRHAAILQTTVALMLSLAAAWYLWQRGLFNPTPGTAAGGSGELDPTRVAVLYFDDNSEDGGLGHLADGLTEDLIDELARIEALEVRSRKAVEPYRPLEIPLDSAARALRVGSVVEGSVARSGGRIRVTVRLTDPVRATLIGSETVEVGSGDWFAVRDTTIDEVVFLMQRRLGREILVRERRTETGVDEAWVTLLRAERERKSASRLQADGDLAAAARALARSDSLLRTAESLDRDWAEPKLLRGWVALDRVELGESVSLATGAVAPADAEETLRAGLEHAESALEIQPGMAEALELRGTLRYRLWELPESSRSPEDGRALLNRAEQDLRTAVEDHPWPARALATLSDLLRKRGSLADAYVMAERAYEADPFLFLSLEEGRDVLSTVAQAALDAGESRAALRWCELGADRFPESQFFVACSLSVIAYSANVDADPDRAWELARAWVERSPAYSLPFTRAAASIQVASVLARADRPDSARTVLESALEDAPDEHPDLWYYEAAARLRLGQRAEALRLLDRFLEARPSWRAYVEADWLFEPLLDDPRFRSLVEAP